MGILVRFLLSLFRKKPMSKDSLGETKLARVLTFLDLTLLGIGSTLGAGAYVLSGEVARTKAGPSIVLSFAVAAAVSVLAGLCYAEFGARIPKTGSAYVYSFITVGEMIAFIIGWNLILEYAIGTASVGRAWTANFNSLIDNRINNFLNSTMHIDVPYISEFPDFFAFGLTALLTILLAAGVKQSTLFNNIFTVINLLVLSYVIICGFFVVDVKNWKLKKEDVPEGFGEGGFMPYGISGVLSGAATCFYGFVGFDCIATTGEEAKNPQKAIPLSIIISLLVVFLFYFGISLVITMMCPYYLLNINAPLPAVFERVGWDIAKYIIAVGAICALSASMVGAIFPLPRVVYAMAEDRLLFGCLGTVSEKFKTPVAATLVAGLFTGITALVFDLTELVNMMSIGTLLAYTFVAKCVVILRYKVKAFEDGTDEATDDIDQSISINSSVQNISKEDRFSFIHLFRPQSTTPTKITERIVLAVSSILSLFTIFLDLILVYAEDDLSRWWIIALLAVTSVVIVFLVTIIFLQPPSPDVIPFKVPLVPFTPELSAAVNIYLMLKLPPSTWIRFLVWMIVGFFIYALYGYRHSTAKKTKSQPHKYLPITNED